jgi:YidC/Oxa1 family membrane protein insertase
MAPAAYVGPVVYNDKDNFKKVEFARSTSSGRSQPQAAFTKSADNGWIGMIEHYFVAAWLPPQDTPIARSSTRQARRRPVHAGVRYAEGTIAPGATGELARACTSARRTRTCSRKTAKGLDLVVDYGIFTVLGGAALSCCSSGCTASSATGAGRSS